jgi:uncharacterized protein (DUF2342 family)
MKKSITITAMLIAMNSAMAVAQSNTGASGPVNAATKPAATSDQRLAPVGHRQPRVTSATADTNINKIDPEDAALDRKLKSICRGC